MAMTRREFLSRAAPLGGAAAAGAVAGRWIWAESADPNGESYGHSHGATGSRDPGSSHDAGYGHGPGPPRDLLGDALTGVTVPPPPDLSGGGARHRHEMTVTGRRLEVAEGRYLDAWVYAGTMPGPVIRSTEGDRLEIVLQNRTSRPHNFHLHGAHDPGMDGWEPIPAGGEFTYELTARPFGLHPYHCHTPPLAEHVARGLYGTMIVDPPGGRPPAHEFVLVLGGFDLDGDGRNELYGWNGVAGYFAKFPLKVPVGDLVRCYIVNMVEYEPVASFHLHAETFDVYRSGTSLSPDEHTDMLSLQQGERAIVEFRLPKRGRYMFHPHQHHMASGGATGWFSAV